MSRIGLLLPFLALSPDLAIGQAVDAITARVNGVSLTYAERGRGDPLILLHGGQGDYRAWEPQVQALSARYRVIAYSRRYNHPNDNPVVAGHSVFTDAEDLAALIRHLKLGPVHLVGTSAGALVALVLATQQPDMARTLVLAEPPVHSWARNDPQGQDLYQEFMRGIWNPAGDAFKAGDEQGAMRILVDGFGGSGRFDALPPAGRTVAMQNARFFKVATASRDPFPDLSKERVQRLSMPVLIVTGETTLRLHKFVNEELARLLPAATRVTIPRAGHGSPRENPSAFNEAVTAFLATSGR